jgi:uncharacterized protein YkwD
MTQLTIYLGMMLFSSNFSPSTAPQDRAQLAQVQQMVQVTEEEQRFIDLVNSERWAQGLPTLKLDPTLVEIARRHCRDMYDHISPTPGKTTLTDRYLSFVGKRPRYAILGENLFYSSVTDVNRGHKCLMDSAYHRENILNPRFDRIGVGIFKDDTGQFWVTELFLFKID